MAGVLLAPPAALARELADTIYSGGPILTMNDATPSAEAVAVRDGKVLAVGTAAEVESHRGPETKTFDLAGRTMLPGFFDAHGHMLMGGLQALSANLLSPPDGEVTDIASLTESLRGWAASNADAVAQANLVIGFGYDPAQLVEERHPTREDLDTVSADVPVFVVHQSGHMGAANSKALEAAGITSDSEDPAGGKILRGADGQPTGVLEENAFYAALSKLIQPLGAEGFETFARAGAELWARYGYTTAEEGRSVPATADVLRKVADEGGFKIDVLTYPDVLVDRDYIAAHVSREYQNRFRVAGAKLTIDGSPQGFTALRDRPYYDPVGDYPPGYKGYAAATMEQTVAVIDWAFANGIQINTHANAEGASDMLIASIDAATKKYGPADRRAVLIHGQFLREDQVDSYKRLNVFMSLFPMHTFYWGDWHREHTVGPELVDDISPTGWLVKRGMRFSTHHDAPVAFPDSMRVLDATVTRRSRSGDIVGPAQRVDVMTALKAMTIWPAYQHFEETTKGSIEPGKLADFVVLSADPTAIDPETLDTIDVLATIKEGEVVFEAR
ncbi:amidohydrolase [Acuticoccus sediminis]|uniref:Amidohydrolase n=1 Tax=Acuticoccus sediminis TaxID=2184697 RepID=A0A8B2P0N0_9HYPH|nr:amidohydrolase [Acuticoccus sediminis]RAI03524.1 amidohydrolase [Acuticoccus sediminis]